METVISNEGVVVSVAGSAYGDMLTSLSQFQAQSQKVCLSCESLAVLSSRQGKFAGIGKVGTYPASQSKI
jgi:hypothetical protein